VKAAQAAVDATHDAVEAGTSTALEHLDALSRLSQSRFLVEQSSFQINSAILTLLFSQGKEIRY